MERFFYQNEIDDFLATSEDAILGALARNNTLDDITDIRSSLFLEDAASEFDVQGLELDWTCLVWDGNLRRKNNGWQNFSFTGNRWLNIRSEERKAYQINAYRVLLTRARQGMVICVPEGNPDDATRLPEFYDGTYEYFKQIGLTEIEN